MLRTERKAFGNLVIIQRETRLYQSGALIPLGPSKITRDYDGFERWSERDERETKPKVRVRLESRRRIDIFDCNLVCI